MCLNRRTKRRGSHNRITLTLCKNQRQKEKKVETIVEEERDDRSCTPLIPP